jgi:hypothetical protein
MKNRTLQVLLLGLVGIAATAHCGKSDSTGTPSLGPTDVVVTWTFDGKPASGMECVTRGIASVAITLSATNDVTLHQNATVDCDKGTVTFAGLDTASLGTPFLEGTVIDGKGMTLTRTDTTVMPKPGKTAVTLDFFATTMTTSGDPATTSGDPATSSASSGGGGAGGAGGMAGTSAAATTGSTAASSTAASSSSGSGAGGAGSSSASTGP